MYKNRKINKNAKRQSTETNEIPKKRPLNAIDENASLKLTRMVNETTTITQHKNPAKDPGDLDEMFSEENIPASQEPTQRYLSQRSTIAATLRRTQSSNTTARPPKTYFELVLMKAGVQFDEADTFVLSCDHIVFVSKFRELLMKAPNYPENIETFKQGLSDGLSGKSRLAQKLLGGCTISIPGEESVYQSQDSMMVNFLMIECLRDHVVEVLLDKIEEQACSTNSQVQATSSGVPLLPLMLTQLQYVVGSHSTLIYERIKEIYARANSSAKYEIIANAEFVIESSKHDDFAEMLCDSVTESSELFKTVTIQTLTNLCLSAYMQAKLRSKILAFIKEGQCPLTTLPVLIKFMLKILSEDSDDSARELVHTLREVLMSDAIVKTANERNVQLELFGYIEHGLTRSKRFYTIWQKVIATLPGTHFRSIDLLLLLILVNIKDDNSLYIENILRRRIKLEQISVEILEDAKLKYSPVLEKYTDSLMQILHDFLREKHRGVANFARVANGILFQICETTQKSILKKLMDLSCDKTASNMTNLALQLLKELQQKYPKEVQNWGNLLMPLLDRLSELTLSQTRLAMELLCYIAFPAPNLSECPVLQDQIDMLVKKQLINRNPFIKRQGIIGSVQLIDNIARIEETFIEHDDFNLTFNTVSDLPDGRGKVAANYVVRIQSATMHCAESLALFYDELASVCANSPFDRPTRGLLYDKPFLIWLCEVMTYFFQNSFVAEDHPDSVDGIPLAYLKCINKPEDTTNSEEAQVLGIGINIAELVLKPSNKAASSILVLAPLFNLVRVLSLQRYEGSLETINALLGCAIILPEFFDDPNVDNIIYDYDELQKRKILDIYFHCVNWMRVTITSFATQREDVTRQKVLQRLADLIDVEQKIRHLLRRAPADYNPPMCQFTSISTATVNKSAGRGRPAGVSAKTKANNAPAPETQEDLSMNETNANQTRAGNITRKLAAITKPKANKIDFDKLYGPREVYRQMDSDLMLILHEQFTIEYPLPMAEVGHKFGLLEFRFILNDLVSKLESIVSQKTEDTEQTTLQHLAKPHHFINDLSKFLRIIVTNMDVIATAIKQQLCNVNYAYGNGDLFTDEFGYLKVCLGLCLRLLACYFAWSGFYDVARAQLLKDSLLAILPLRKSQSMRAKSTAVLAAEVFNICLSYEPTVVSLGSAVHLYQLLQSLKRHSYVPNDATVTEKQAQDMRTLCRTFLCRKWFNYDGTIEKGAQANVYLDELVKGFLKDSDLRRLKDIFRIVCDESQHLNGKDSVLKSFPNFKKANFPILFRGLCEILISSMNDQIAIASDGSGDKLRIWEKSCDLLNTLLDIVQNLDVPRNFSFFLKYSHLYLKLVLQHGLQVFEKHLRENPERVSALLKNLQLTTRFLHNLCCHSKALKNITIISQIPFLRETVENLVFRVKALLVANKCASVFWMGNLLNKDLHGDQILSQTLSSVGQNENDSEEEIPEDDQSVDETLSGDPPVNHESGDSLSVHAQNSAASSDASSSSKSKSKSRSKCF